MSEIPVVDIRTELPWEDDSLVARLNSAFTTVGFVFVKNHGIDRELIDQTFRACTEFFTSPLDTKMKYVRNPTTNSGYVCMEGETLNPSKPSDLKECFNVCDTMIARSAADPEAQTLKEILLEIHKSATYVAKKLLQLMGHALELKDPCVLVDSHRDIGKGSAHNMTTLRALYYPPLPSSLLPKPGQMRCGEHVDYGSITLLFQDPGGGLQVRCVDGGYIDVPYRPDAILVNIGALMERWTGDIYKATPHRVLIPEEDIKRNSVRQSIAFFVHPDNSAMIQCLDGSGKYSPINALEDTLSRLKITY